MVGLPDDILGRSSERLAAHATHWGFFYALLIVQPLSGWIPLYSRRISHQRSRRAETGIDIAVSDLIVS